MRSSSYIVILFCLCCLLSHAHADMTPVRILVGTSEMPLAPSPVYDGTRVLAPVSVLERLGATGAYSAGGITITAASGQSGIVRTIEVGGRTMLPMDRVMEIVGGEQTLDAANRTLTLLAHLESVEFDNDTLKINCSFPARASVRAYDGKLVVDVIGAKVASEAREVYIGAPAVERARLGQYNPTTARVVVDLTKPTGYELQTQDATAQLLVKIADGLSQSTGSSSFAASVTINSLVVQPLGEKSFDVVVATSGRARASKDFSVVPPRIVLGIPKARIAQNYTLTGSHSLLTPELVDTATGVKLTLSLEKPLDYSVETAENAIIIHVRPLLNSGGTLAGKTVLVDPGHGGREKGACSGGAMEKSLNMQLAKDLAAALEKQGARVLFSRNTDVEVKLADRPRAAVDRGADFFISIHCNSSMAANSATGIETYYHMQEPSAKTMAYLIHDGVCQSTGMCDRRARSDSSLYSSGLKVLRDLSGTGVPGILLECGYINHSSDRAKLLSALYRRQLADGVVAGLKAYIQDLPIQ